MKKIIGLSLSIFCLCFFSCSKHIPSVYEVVSMGLSNSNNTLEKPFDAGTDSIPKQAYAIKMTLNEAMRDKTEGDANENGFKNQDQLTALNIYSLNNFDGTHPAGTSLNSYFLTALGSSASIPVLISNGQIGGGKIVDNNYVDNWSTEQYFFLMTPPAVSGNYSFVIDMGMSDGRTMSDTVTVRLY